MSRFALTCQSTLNGTPGAIGRTIDSDVKVGRSIFDHHIGETLQHHLKVAALVRTTAAGLLVLHEQEC